MAVLLLTGDLSPTQYGDEAPVVNTPTPYPTSPCSYGQLKSAWKEDLVVAGVTCGLSILGSGLIILFYLLSPKLRSRPNTILLHLSLMDFMAATANLVGIATNFNKLLSDDDLSDGKRRIIENLCIAQASFGLYGTISSILWTICVAVYIYLRVMYERTQVAKRSCYAFYLICYGTPLIVTFWFALTGKLGYSAYTSSGWCGLAGQSPDDKPSILSVVMANDIYVYMTIVLVPVIYVALYFNVRPQDPQTAPINKSISRPFITIEKKLLLIPVVFIFLRMWSLLFTIMEVESGHTDALNCKAINFFLIMAGIGDCGQGFANAIIFCLITPAVYRRCCCCRRVKEESTTKSYTHTFFPSTDLTESEEFTGGELLN